MRKAKKSIHVEVVALSLFIGVLALYAVFSTLNSNVKAEANIDAGGNTFCKSEWDKCDQMQGEVKEKCIKTERETKQAKGASLLKCPTTSGCIAHCESGICRGDGGAPGCPNASDEGAKKAMDAAKKAAEDLAKKAGEGGGKPELPKPEQKPPKPPEQKDPNACSNGQLRGADGKCPDANPLASFGSKVTDFFKSFVSNAKAGEATDVDKQLQQAINNDQNPIDDATQQQIAELIRAGNVTNKEKGLPPVDVQKTYDNYAHHPELEQAVEDAQKGRLILPAQNPIQPATGSFRPDGMTVLQENYQPNYFVQFVKWLSNLF